MRPAVDYRRCREILGVKPECTKDELKQAYHDLVKVWHPDRFANDAALQSRAEIRLKEINEAYDALKNLGPQDLSGTSSRSRPSPSYPRGPSNAASAPAKRVYGSFVWTVLLITAIVLLGAHFYRQSKPQTTSTQDSFRHLV